jgi:hypothetical protein
MTYFMRLATDPHARPTVSGSVTDYAELSPAPWFGLAICDPHSYPQNPCTPDSDSNVGSISAPGAAGSAFMELQFYPPGFGPFADAPSCDQRSYCAALTIDSLECSFNFSACNNNCIEPINFAYIQRNGVPVAAPSPQLASLSTFVPNGQTLLMNQGDSLQVSITDPPAGLTIVINDLTTHQTGTMVASAANGFMNTDPATCGGMPFTFHAEYSTAAQPNQVPWAALEGGVLMEDETGHFEACNSVANPLGLFSYDPSTYQTCVGPNESGGSGEGCTSFTVCTGATTEGGGPCPSSDPASGYPCEFSDAACMPAGPRAVNIPGEPPTWTWPIAGCQADVLQNGDLDFDGLPYKSDWPDGTANYPSSFVYTGPFDAHGKPYPQVQFETDVAGSEILCNVATGAGCTAPPLGAAFYPFWTIGAQPNPAGFPQVQSPHGPPHGHPHGPHDSTVCLWNFGNDIAGVTTQDFGKTNEYGTPDVSRYAGTLASPVMSNPQLDPACR